MKKYRQFRILIPPIYEEPIYNSSCKPKTKAIIMARHNCGLCDYNTDWETDFRVHNLRYHRQSEEELPHICDTENCHRRYVTKFELAQHQRNCPLPNLNKEFPCTVCVRSFGTKRAMKAHWRDKHQNVPSATN